MNVGNYLSISGEPDYDEALVETIARRLIERPVQPGYDIYEYWSDLAAARGYPLEDS